MPNITIMLLRIRTVWFVTTLLEWNGVFKSVWIDFMLIHLVFISSQILPQQLLLQLELQTTLLYKEQRQLLHAVQMDIQLQYIP